MTFITFIQRPEVGALNEFERAKAIAYYLHKKESVNEFDLPSLSQRFVIGGYSKPNESRLKAKMVRSKEFLKGTSPGFFRLHVSAIGELNIKYEYLKDISEDIMTENSILPETLYLNTRGFIEKLAKQINASYEHNLADACAVLMRRLLEILLIMGYQNKQKQSEIQDGVSYRNLVSIIDYTISNKTLSLQKDTHEVLHDFRELGNFSAHGLNYNCRKEEIRKVARKFRFAVEDMLYASGLKK